MNSAAIDDGILVEADRNLSYIHWLAHSWRSAARNSVRPRARRRCEVPRLLRRRRDWDAAFEVVSRNRLDADLEQLVLDALDDLLDAARFRRSSTGAIECSTQRPVFCLARAEVALRHGRYSEAQAHSEAAVEEDSALNYRALSVAGRAAHLASREEKALELFRLAEDAAVTDATRRDARWGQLLCMLDLDTPDARATLADLSLEVSLSNPREVLRAATCTLVYQLRGGSLDVPRRTWQPSCSPP